jgi:hypothetical protein
MKNITLAVDEAVLDEVRKYAANHGTTVNALVRQHLERIARNENRAKEAMRELRKLAGKSKGDVGVINWKRDDLYDR